MWPNKGGVYVVKGGVHLSRAIFLHREGVSIGLKLRKATTTAVDKPWPSWVKLVPRKVSGMTRASDK